MKATAVMQQVLDQGKQKANADARIVGALSHGDFVAQGDVNFWYLESIPRGCSLVKQPAKQLAPGTTKGSRHELQSFENCAIYQLNSPNELQGPVLEASAPITITHPEHGDITLPRGVYLVTYQRQFAEELRRVRD